MGEQESVWRMRPLPTGPIRGTFLIAEGVLTATAEALTEFALAGIRDGGHEGLVYWCGREFGPTTIYLAAVLPAAEHSAQRVSASKEAIGAVARKARAAGLGVVCQVHSHPGRDTRHSDGDDDMVLMPFEGMLSIVIPTYGVGMRGLKGAGIHQFQDGRWVHCTAPSATSAIKVVPAMIDAREG